MRVRADLVPLADRLAALQGTRLLVATTVVATTTFFDTDLTDRASGLVALVLTWVLVTAGLEAMRRLLRRRALLLVSSLLLLDGLVLAVVVAETGGSGSSLLFLVHLHVLACTLLASVRSGIWVAAWHALLLVSTHHLAWLDAADRSSATTSLAVAAASFLLVAGASGSFASLNERALRHSRKAADSLVRLGTALEGCRSVDDVVATAVEHFCARLGGQRAAVLVFGPDESTGACAAGSVTVLVHTRAPGRPDAGGAQSRLAAMLTGPGDWLLSGLLPDAQNVAVVPLVADGSQIGVAAIEYGSGRRALRRDELDLVEQCVTRVALSARTAQLLAEVESLAASDPLTGLPNRRLFDATLEREVARARRARVPVAVAMLDVDHFKLVNDHHGHQVGDEVLRQLAAALEKAARRESVVARYGGEEFVVLFPDATVQEAMVAAERLRRAAADVQVVPVTVSVGVAAGHGDLGPQDLIAAADAALYEAKAQGRDRVVRHTSELDHVVSG